MTPVLLALLAYTWWGLVPLYWKQLLAFPAEELILYRVLLSAIFLALFLPFGSRWQKFLVLCRHRRTFLGLSLSGLLIGCNWYLYVWAVNHGHVVDASLGYFINPLLNVALGTLFLGERMDFSQRVACAFAFAGTALLTWSTGELPWIALALASSFALYGFIRKKLMVETLSGTFFETTLFFLPAALALLWMQKSGGGHSGLAATDEWAWLSFCGVITTVPLLAFAEASKRMPLSSLGFFQFISPSIQFLLGVFLYGEPFGPLQWLSFSLIWAGLAFFLLDLARARR